jgi:hypothetical protein
MRPIRRVFEHLTLKQMLQLETPQDQAIRYALHAHEVHLLPVSPRRTPATWQGLRVPQRVRLATDPRNPLWPYYSSLPHRYDVEG